ncbi:type IV pilin protein [Thermaerobacter marianensis]|nr:prepilin-type N-terminal cleavage/methylation domain-containing protein [Thermaerobacter marianensis]
MSRPGAGRDAGSRQECRTGRQRGFTLIELGVVLAVLAILVAIAVPTYLRMVARAREAEAQQAWSMVKAELWSYFLQNGQFPQPSGTWPSGIDQPTPPNWDFTARGGGTQITVVAQPTTQNRGGETLCWTLDQNGQVSTNRGDACNSAQSGGSGS